MAKKDYKIGDIIKTSLPRYTTQSKNGSLKKAVIRIPITGKIKKINLVGPKVYIITEGRMGDFPTRTIK